MCDNRSELFMEKLYSNFPDLIFEHKYLEEKFIFNKNDSFTYNMYNKSDSYIYFVILFPRLKDEYHVMSWVMGVPFLKKYILSFNFENKMIGYYKKIVIVHIKNFFPFWKKYCYYCVYLSFYFGFCLRNVYS